MRKQRDAIRLGDSVIVRPKTTAFDRPIWTMSEKGVVRKIGRTRATVELSGSPDAIYSFKFEDLDFQ